MLESHRRSDVSYIITRLWNYGACTNPDADLRLYNTRLMIIVQALSSSPASLSVAATCDDNDLGLLERAVLYITRPADASEQSKFPANPTSLISGRSEPSKLV